MTRNKRPDQSTVEPKTWWQRVIAGEQSPNRLFHHFKCDGTVEDHREIALDVRELIRQRLFDRPVGSVFALTLRLPWLRALRLGSCTLELQLVAGRAVMVPLVWASCGVMGEQLRHDAGIDICQSQAWMLGKDMTATGLAPFAIALRSFVVRANIFFTPCNLHAFWAPQCEGIDGTGRPMAARSAMTIAHACGLTGHRKLDRATETTSIVTFWTTHIAFFLCRALTLHSRPRLAGAQLHLNELADCLSARRPIPWLSAPIELAHVWITGRHKWSQIIIA